MKIEPFPWFEGYLINMDELYTELTLEKIERKLLGEETWSLQTYEDMFNCNKSEHKNRKVLMKADPGMGKTTLGRKMSWDWASGKFEKFSVIFFVALKLVKHGDTIENAIMQQNPELEGLHVSEQKLRGMLSSFRSKILIILDGLDEHGLGTNVDVVKMIKNQKLLGCSILISSRPHSTWQIEQYFATIVRVDGFTEKEAKKFVSNFVTTESKIKQIMTFRPSDSREDFPIQKCPILLAILCFLVKKKKVDLSDRNITIGDLYFKMIEYLYRQFTLKKGISFELGQLLQVLRSVGKLALHTLLSNNPLLQKSEVLRIAGDFVLDYGFLAGHRDFTDPTTDIYVTYAHRSIEEFFGSFGFLQALNDGESIDDILGSDCKEPIFMVNPLVMKFCLWILSEKSFDFRDDVYNRITIYAAKLVDHKVLDPWALSHRYPAFNIPEALLTKDNLILTFCEHVFGQCAQVRVLQFDKIKQPRIRLKPSVDTSHLVDGSLGLMSEDFLNRVKLVLIKAFLPSSISNDTLVISIENDGKTALALLHLLLWKYKLDKRNPQVYAQIECSENPKDLTNMSSKFIEELHLEAPYSRSNTLPTLSMTDFPYCPNLNYFSVSGFHIDDPVSSAFMKAVQNGKLRKLKQIEFTNCTMANSDWPEISQFSYGASHFFLTEPPHMKDKKLQSKLTELYLSNIRFSDEPMYTEYFSRMCLTNISALTLCNIHPMFVSDLNQYLANGKLPNLSELAISMYLHGNEIDPADQGYGHFCYLDLPCSFFKEFKPTQLQKLELSEFPVSAEELQMLSEKLASLRLLELSISECSGMTGNLSALLTNSFPNLHTLLIQNWLLECG